MTLWILFIWVSFGLTLAIALPQIVRGRQLDLVPLVWGGVAMVVSATLLGMLTPVSQALLAIAAQGPDPLTTALTRNLELHQVARAAGWGGWASVLAIACAAIATRRALGRT